MHRRSILISLAFLASCASSPERVAEAAFKSDRIQVEARGHGRDVIFIPGLTSHPDVWRSTVASLGHGYRVHLVHVRGFAGLEPGANAEGPVSAPAADEIARYIAERNLNSPAVVGHSMGGTIGMMLAVRHPDRVGRLMVVDMSPFLGAMFGGPNATADTLRPIADGIRAQMAAAPQGVASDMTRQRIDSMVATEGARAEIVEHTRTSNNATAANAFHELIITDLRPELHNIAMPFTTLYVAPTGAPITPERYATFLRASYANIPHARIVFIENSRHFIMVDQHERFMQELRAFLTQ